MEKHIGVMTISHAGLLSALHLPADTKITDMCDALEENGTIHLRIEHPDLPLCKEGHTVRRVRPKYRAVRHEEIFFDGWAH